jgi:nucleotidyltransferase/DNA polymerase involved in DNA repair
VPAREPEYRAAHQALVAAAQTITDRVETAELGVLYLDARGLGRRFDSANDLADELAREAERISGLSAQVGVAEGTFIAYEAARAACPGEGCAVPPGQERAFVASLPLSVLPSTSFSADTNSADLEMVRRLHLLGISTLGGLAALSRQAVVRQFGSNAGFLHDLSRGIDTRPVHPDSPPLALERRRTFSDALRERASLKAHVREVVAEMAENLVTQGLQAERLCLGLEEESGEEHISGGLLKPPSADGEKLARMAETLLEQLAPAWPVEAISLVAYPLRSFHLGAVQMGFFRDALDRAYEGVRALDVVRMAGRFGRSRHELLREALRRLRERFGDMIVTLASLIGPPSPRAVCVTTGPSGMPCALVWRERVQEVTLIYETWRTRTNWWRLPEERDYFRVETTDGRMHVLFHDLETDQWMLERRHI